MRRLTTAVPRVTATVILTIVGLTACSEEGDPATRDRTERDPAGQIIEAGELGVLELRVGDCFTPLPGQQAVASPDSVVTGLPCEQAHVSEVYAVIDVGDDGDEFPGVPDLAATAGSACIEAYLDYLGIVYERSELEADVLSPTEASWEAGDRSVVCTVRNPDSSERTGSVRDAAL